MPEVGIFDSPQPNAFATGPQARAALVAVSSGLLVAMNRSEVEAVLGHEMTHVANGDMVTLTLIQGVVNTFVIFLSGSSATSSTARSCATVTGEASAIWPPCWSRRSVLGILASLIVMWFSRQREFRADAGGARLAGRERMIAALERLRAAHDRAAARADGCLRHLRGAAGGRLTRLFMSHPPLDERIAALRRPAPEIAGRAHGHGHGGGNPASATATCDDACQRRGSTVSRDFAPITA